jgi:hypothetical protein
LSLSWASVYNAETVGFQSNARSAPKGASELAETSVSLKRYPDTNLLGYEAWRESS